MLIIDLSLPIDENTPEVHSFWIERIQHDEGIRHLNWILSKKSLLERILFYLGKRIIKPKDLPDEEFLSLETVYCPVHIGTHIDSPFHYGRTCEGRPSKLINDLPLSWCFSDGVVLNFTAKEPGEVITREDIEICLNKIGYEVKPFDIVLFQTGADKYFGTKEYLTHYPGVSPEAIAYLLEKGVKIVGTDAPGLDRPYKFMLADFLRTRNPDYLWPVHFFGRKKEYAHIERLANLKALPKPYGFKIACFPVKIKDVGAAWARVVALTGGE